MSDCIFCKIVAGEIPAEKIFESERVLAFRDIEPSAPTHALVIPKEHLESLANLNDSELAGELLAACRAVAEKEGILESGFRVITNIGKEGGQAVPHLHFHVLGGRQLKWEV